MPEKWTGTVVGKMHVNKVTLEDVAKEMGTTKGYVSMILNGKRNPVNAKEKITAALNACIDRKNQM